MNATANSSVARCQVPGAAVPRAATTAKLRCTTIPSLQLLLLLLLLPAAAAALQGSLKTWERKDIPALGPSQPVHPGHPGHICCGIPPSQASSRAPAFHPAQLASTKVAVLTAPLPVIE